MKATTLLFMIGICSISADSVFSQSANLSLNLTDMTIRQAISEIEKNSDYVFVWNNNAHTETNKRVRIDVKNTAIEQILDRLFAGTMLNYHIVGKQVIIYLEKTSEQPSKKADINSIAPGQSVRWITGTVFDENGEPVPGATVAIQGTTRGVITDLDGKFTLDVKTSDILDINYLGYQTYSITVGDQKDLKIQLQVKPNELDEVTVVAFGRQKKESVIGAITTISPDNLRVPSSNLTTAFAGQMAGVIAYQRTGEPGRDDAVDFFVRGITTFGANTNPLILIDNVELTTTDLARLNPDDIASFSIMKDATATALYGARGANGVILVTTKQGREGAAKVFIRLEQSISAPTKNVEFADPVTYMKLHNEAILTRNPLGELMYTQDKIDNTLQPGSSPYIYPANDWYGMLFRNYATSQRVNLNLSGGGTVARYYVSGSFSNDNGILKVDKRNSFNNNIDFKSYNIRSNIDIDITKSTTMSIRLTGNFDDYTGPIGSGEEVYNTVVHSNPILFPAYYPVDEDHRFVKHIMFGNYNNGAYNNPYAQLVKGYQDRSRSQMLAQMEFKQNLDFITEGLSIRAMFNISRLSEYSVSRQYRPFWYELSAYDSYLKTYSIIGTNPESGTEYLDFSESPKIVQATMYSESMLNYTHSFGKHDVSGLLVFTTRENLSANAGTLQLSLPSRNVGLSGRATYAFDGRYFLEYNFGYNGSERFAANHRWGFFPSGGIAWQIANEDFWKNMDSKINSLKLRYSYGLVGNDMIGDANDRFFYLSRVEMTDANYAARFGFNYPTPADQVINGISITRYASDAITWETSTKQNWAIELGLYNKANIIAEYFTEYRRNILMTRAAIPSTMGLTAPVRANVGEASANGVDIQIDYQHIWNKDFWTSARANFTWAASKFRVYEEPEYSEPWRSRVGYSLKQTWGYIAESLFMDDKEAENSPSQSFGSIIGGGDIKYTDVNNDGQITSADMVPIGNPTSPEIIYGFGVSAGYKNIDVSLFFQGLANESFWIDATNTSPFQGQTQLLKVYADSHWSEENQDKYAIWPRLSATLNNNNTQTSTWFMRDGSFLRLKQLELGYTLSGKWQQKLHIGNIRFYLSGTNLLLFSKFKLWDVEMAGNGLGYPIQRTFNMGMNLTFN
ncbi:MAG: TonB-dependent receptor [Tannerella sp.]|jgi:TonB-linked SusC/RagA family outer membrane protein|nr:TonB-dependent receptor [Tannerella sp.]